ncbi:hypothetical protein [Rhodococcus ruber]|uniref:hypothetical protein n=1 Tax=Rhodococcus ruber TaxID=1830 RepID=UPI00265DA5FD|nr:hypothetical protein [Rhodococcus ruber]MDO1481406.1 hypothetical protein [Rhodococcus ruber]
MSERITAGHVAVQVETSRADVWVPDGLAVARRNYDPAGLAFDPNNGLAVLDDSAVVEDGAWLKVRPRSARTIQPVIELDVDTDGMGSDRVVTDVTALDGVQVGPVLAQNRIPVVVRPGMQARFGGKFRVRESGFNNDRDVCAELWGVGSSTDAYGVTTETKVRLMRYTAQLQRLVNSRATHEYTLPTNPWVTVPANVTELYLTISLINAESDAPADLDEKYAGASYRFPRWMWREPDVYVFQSPKITDANALRIYVTEPANLHPTYPHPLSQTGYAFRNRTLFENITPGVEVTVMGTPAGAALSVAVHAWTLAGGRGALLTTIAVPPDTRVVAPIEHTGTIELVCASTFYVESVRAPLVDTATVEQTRLHRIEYANVTDPVNTIRTQLTEADLGISTVRFVSDTVAAQVTAGKRVRILALHPAGHTTLVTGTIRGRRLVHDLRHRQQVEITVHDDWAKLGGTCTVAFDQPDEYGFLLHRLGAPVWINGVDYTGPAGPPPDGHDYFPSYHAPDLSYREALVLTRNARRAFLFVDRAGRIQFTDTLPDEIALTVTDQPSDTELGYATTLELASDTADLVTVVQAAEHLLDAEDYLTGRVATGSPPIRFGPIKAKTQRIDYRRAAAVETYGENKVTLPVLRGTGTHADIMARNFGPSLQDWAAQILDEYAVERDTIRRLDLPVAPGDRAAVAALQPFSAVAVRRGGSTEVLRVRSVAHEIDAATGRWLCTLDFAPDPDRVYWLPDPPPAPELPVVGGFYNDPGAGSYDGGDPAGTGVGIIDGGEA